jgi:CRP-like cAMP-binding protein
LEILGSQPFFEHLPEEKLQDINLVFVERGYDTGAILYLSGSRGERFYVVADGYVKLLRHTMGGKEVMLELLRQGEFFGSLSAAESATYTETAQAQTPTCTLSITTSELRKILEVNPTVTLKLMDAMAFRLQEAHERVRQLSAYTVEQRIAYTLLMLADKAGEQREMGTLIQLPLSRADLASLSGTTPETASRLMSSFQDMGVIQSGRQWVAVTDADHLVSLI